MGTIIFRTLWLPAAHGWETVSTPSKIKMERKSQVLENDFPFQMSFFHVPCWFSRVYLHQWRSTPCHVHIALRWLQTKIKDYQLEIAPTWKSQQHQKCSYAWVGVEVVYSCCFQAFLTFTPPLSKRKMIPSFDTYFSTGLKSSKSIKNA